MEMEGLREFLIFALPGGFLGGIFTWLTGRRKRNNDMLSQLQSSINMLSGENRKILDENVQLRVENAQLKANQEEMLQKLTLLTKEVERLRKVINKKTNEKNIVKSDTTLPADRLRNAEDGDSKAGSRRIRKHEVSTREGGQCNCGELIQDEGGDLGAAESENGDHNGHTAVGDISESDDGEPP